MQSFVVYTDADKQAVMLLQSRRTSAGRLSKYYVSRVVMKMKVNK